MESDKFPIVINGQKYLVDRTFAGTPAIYTGDELSYGIMESLMNEPNLVCIIARKVPQ